MTSLVTGGRVTAPETGDVPFLDLSGMSQEVRDEVLREWERLVDSGRFVGGEPVSRFEDEWAVYCGSSFAVGVANGTDALHLALRALGIGPGDEVVVPTNTFVATAEAVVLAGARPRFADVDPDTLLLTGASLEAACTPATRAVVAVHLYGQMPDMDELLATADRLGLLVLEDAAQAQGASWGPHVAGSLGAAGCFSFYPGKNLGAFGDAGAVCTSDAAVAERLRSMRDHGRSAGGHHQHDLLGTNSRLDSVQAVVLSAKLRRLDRWNAERRQLMAAYAELLDPDVALVRQLPGGCGVHHLAVARVPDRDRLRERLAEQGIGTGLHYPTPCHLLPPYRGYAHAPLPVAEAQASRIVSLPLYPHMGLGRVARVAETLNELVQKERFDDR